MRAGESKREGPDRLQWLVELRADQRRRWLNGERDVAATDLARYPELASDRDSAVDVIYAEFVLREELGEDARSLTNDYLQQFPDLADALRRQFDMHFAFLTETGQLSGDGERSTCPGANGRTRTDLPDRIDGYCVEREIARGAMGRIVRVRDVDFERPLAMKILLGQGEQFDERFLFEARLTGLLQHPGIPPVHALGKLDDGRPYFVMKLIQGRSLLDLLSERASPAADLPEFIRSFQQICQTVGYAHSRRVVHRDLKPGNIMVGAFGEVQVMDWGLAKVLPQAGEAPPVEQTELPAPEETTFRVQRTADVSECAGSVMGTPAYMAPEQARGEVDRVDARTDVFGLGAILCEILTGDPPFTEEDALDQAKAGDVIEALSRLARCGADAELVDLACRCLSPRLDDRPADGSVVASQVAGYQAALEQRLRHAEVERAAATARAEEEIKRRAAERQRRRVVMYLAATVLFGVVVVSAFAIWIVSDRIRQATRLSERRAALNAAVTRATDEATRTFDDLDAELQHEPQVYALAGELEKWRMTINEVAGGALRRARDAANEDTDLVAPQHQTTIDALQERLDKEERLRKFAGRLRDISEKACRDTRFPALDQYAQAFDKEADLSLTRGEVQEAAARVHRHPLRFILIAHIDHWAEIAAEDSDLTPRLLAIANAADSDNPLRKKFRDPGTWTNLKRLQKLARDIDQQEQQHSPQLIVALASRINAMGGDPTDLLDGAVNRYPREFLIVSQLHLYHRNKDTLADLKSQSGGSSRYRAACDVVRGALEKPPAQQQQLREEALNLLLQDLHVFAKQVQAGNADDMLSLLESLPTWRANADLASVRDDKALRVLPESSRKDWRALWAEVDRLVNQIRVNVDEKKYEGELTIQEQQKTYPLEVVPGSTYFIEMNSKDIHSSVELRGKKDAKLLDKSARGDRRDVSLIYAPTEADTLTIVATTADQQPAGRFTLLVRAVKKKQSK